MKVTRSCPTLFNPVDCSPPDSPVHEILWGRILRDVLLGCHFLLQGIFLTQGSNPGLLHCRQILDHLSHHQYWVDPVAKSKLKLGLYFAWLSKACGTFDHFNFLKTFFLWFADTTPVLLDFPCGSAGKESACHVGDLGSIPGLGRSPGEGKGYLLQYFGLENSTDYSPWGHKSRTRLNDFHFHSTRNHFLTQGHKNGLIFFPGVL